MNLIIIIKKRFQQLPIMNLKQVPKTYFKLALILIKPGRTTLPGIFLCLLQDKTIFMFFDTLQATLCSLESFSFEGIPQFFMVFMGAEHTKLT